MSTQILLFLPSKYWGLDVGAGCTGTGCTQALAERRRWLCAGAGTRAQVCPAHVVVSSSQTDPSLYPSQCCLKLTLYWDSNSHSGNCRLSSAPSSTSPPPDFCPLSNDERHRPYSLWYTERVVGITKYPVTEGLNERFHSTKHYLTVLLLMIYWKAQARNAPSWVMLSKKWKRNSQRIHRST